MGALVVEPVDPVESLLLDVLDVAPSTSGQIKSVLQMPDWNSASAF